MKRVIRFTMVCFCILLLTGFTYGYVSDRGVDLGKVDFRGATVTLVGWWDPFEAFREGGDRAGRLEEAKKLFNIKDIKFMQIPWGEKLQETMMSRLMAGDSGYDFWMLPHTYYFPLRTAGAIYPASDILGEGYYTKLPNQHQKMAEKLGYGGKKYTFSVFNGINYNTVFMVFNRTLLEREGIKSPHEYYKEGKWTWEVLTEIAKKVTKDLNNDGQIDQWGLSYPLDVDWIHANGGAISRVKDNKIVYTGDEPATANALKQIYQWMQVDKIVGDTWEKKKFFNGEVAFASLATYEINQLKDSMKDKFGVAPLPKGPNTKEYHYPSDNVDSLYLPANSKDPKAMLALDNFLWPVEEFLEGEEEGFADMAPDETSFRILKEGVEKWTGECGYMQGILGTWYKGGWGEVFSAVTNGEKTAAAATAEYKPRAQALLDEAFQQK